MIGFIATAHGFVAQPLCDKPIILFIGRLALINFTVFYHNFYTKQLNFNCFVISRIFYATSLFYSASNMKFHPHFSHIFQLSSLYYYYFVSTCYVMLSQSGKCDDNKRENCAQYTVSVYYICRPRGGFKNNLGFGARTFLICCCLFLLFKKHLKSLYTLKN